MTRIRSQLSGLPSGQTSKADLKSMAAAIFHTRGIVMLWLEDIHNDLDRQHLVNLAEAAYGKRAPK
jgi:hypothetical protein